VEKVLYDAANPNRLLAFGGTSRNWNEADTFGWIWESTDGGENWRHIGTISEDGFSTEAKKGANIHHVQYERVPKRGCICAPARVNWFISNDSGRTWRRHQPQGLPHKPRSITFSSEECQRHLGNDRQLHNRAKARRRASLVAFTRALMAARPSCKATRASPKSTQKRQAHWQ
jgi:photosystem II stability/assembly factor-like uncharacterized protein